MLRLALRLVGVAALVALGHDRLLLLACGFNDRCDGPFTSLHKRHELGENESRASFRVPRIPPFSPPPELNPHTPKGNRAVRPAFTSAWSSALFSNVWRVIWRSEEHTSELQSLMRISYAVFCLKNKKTKN